MKIILVRWAIFTTFIMALRGVEFMDYEVKFLIG